MHRRWSACEAKERRELSRVRLYEENVASMSSVIKPISRFRQVSSLRRHRARLVCKASSASSHRSHQVPLDKQIAAEMHLRSMNLTVFAAQQPTMEMTALKCKVNKLIDLQTDRKIRCAIAYKTKCIAQEEIQFSSHILRLLQIQCTFEKITKKKSLTES